MKTTLRLVLGVFLLAASMGRAVTVVCDLGVPEGEWKTHGGAALYVFSPLKTVQEHLTRPQGLRFTIGFGLGAIRGQRWAGAPDEVVVMHPNGTGRVMSFAEAETKKDLYGLHVRLLDAEGNLSVEAPVYIDVSRDGDARWRFHAQGNAEHALGEPVHVKNLRTGKITLFSESGCDVVPFPDGAIHQVKTPEYLAEVVRGEQEGAFSVRVYAATDVLPNLQNGRYVSRVDAEVLREYTWIPVSPERGKALRVRLTAKEEEGWDRTWLHDPERNAVGLCERDPETGEVVREMEKYDIKTTFGSESMFSRFGLSKEGALEGERSVRRTYRTPEGARRVLAEKKRVRGGETVSWIRRTFYEEPGALCGLIRTGQDLKGDWVAYAYDEQGRKTLELRPLEEIGPVGSDGSDGEGGDLADLLVAFDGPDYRLAPTRVDDGMPVRYVPSEPPERVSADVRAGKLLVYDYTPLVASDTGEELSDCPRTTTIRVNGDVVSRVWKVFGYDATGMIYAIREQSHNPEATFGDEGNTQTRIVYHGPHSRFKGSPRKIEHPDGRIEAFYYDVGNWDSDTEAFREDLDGGYVRTEHTTGVLHDGKWSPGAVSRTTVTEEEEERTVFQQRRTLGADGEWR